MTESSNYQDKRQQGGRLRIDLKRMEHAIAAEEYGSFRQAAEALSIKQSTLSRSILTLEHFLGLDIFERFSGGVRATPLGRQFLRRARSILEQVEILTSATTANGRGEAGRLVVGFCTSLTAGNLRATLLEYRTRFPQVELGTIERSRAYLTTALRNGFVDVHISTGDASPFDCKTAPLWSERLLVVLPNNHFLATRDVVHWTDLRSETVLLSQYDPGHEFETLLNANFSCLANAHALNGMMSVEA
ncbi:LysR family transcriptional regulator [Bradyrhizobium manausense]